MMNEMMKNCIREDGKPDFGKMKEFMEDCGCGCNHPMTGSQNPKSSSEEKSESEKGVGDNE